MRFIHKNSSPAGLERYKLQDGASYNLMGKDAPEAKLELRTSLLSEQGYICAYCGSRIDNEHSVIEHVKCRQRYPHLQLEYNNMVCSCLGGQDKRSSNHQYPLYCDAVKDNNDIPITPLDEHCGDLFLYDDVGDIHDNESPDAALTITLLNLSNPKLKHRRKAAIDAYRYLSEGETDWMTELGQLQHFQETGKFAEFCFVLQQYIVNYKLSITNSGE